MLIKQFSQTRPVEVEDIPGRPRSIVRFSITPVSPVSDAQGDGRQPSADSAAQEGYNYYQVEVPFGRWNHEGIVNAILRAEYSIDEELALLRNRDDYPDEYERYESFLATARSVAEHLGHAAPQRQPKHTVSQRDVLAGLRRLVEPQLASLSDEQAAAVASLYPSYKEKIGQQVNAGDKLWDDGVLYAVVQPHTAAAEWYPSITPALFRPIAGYSQDEGGEVVVDEYPPYEQRYGHNPYVLGDRMTFTDGEHYECIVQTTVYSPAEYPQAWRKL